MERPESDQVTQLYQQLQELSVAMFTGLGVTQRDAEALESQLSPDSSSPSTHTGDTPEKVTEEFSESVVQLARDVADRAKLVLNTLESLGRLEEEAEILENSALDQERDRKSTEDWQRQWKETLELFEKLKTMEENIRTGKESPSPITE